MRLWRVVVACTVFLVALQSLPQKGIAMIAGDPIGINVMNRISINSGESIYGATRLLLDGIAPWEINSIEVTDPETIKDYWSFFPNEEEMPWMLNYMPGTGIEYFLYDWNLNKDVNGEYETVVTNTAGMVYRKQDTYIYRLVPRVDMTNAVPADRSIINTLTPEIQWQPIQEQLDFQPYYQLGLYTMEGNRPFYRSPLTTATSFSVPEIDSETGGPVLSDVHRYRYRIFVYDAQTMDESNNVSVSEFNEFYIEREDKAPALSYCRAESRVRVDRNPVTRFVGELINGFPEEAVIQIKDPSGQIIGTVGSEAVEDSSGWFGWKPESTDLPSGEYTFEVRDPDTEELYQTCKANYAPNWQLLPVPIVFSPEHESILLTETPTFSWMSSEGATLYRVSIYSYDSEFVYSSSLTPATSLQIPDGYLRKNSAYKARVTAYDGTVENPGNRADGQWNAFYIRDNQETASISGTISVGESGYVHGDNIIVAAFRSQDINEEGSYLGMTMLDHAGSYTLHNLPMNTDIYVYALWDQDNDQERSAGEWYGWHAGTPIQLNEPGVRTGIDVELANQVQEAAISGEIVVDSFEAGHGNIYIGLFKNDIVEGDPVDGIKLNAPGSYRFTGLAAGVEYSIDAYWDVNESGPNGPDPGDGTTNDNVNPMIPLPGENTGFNLHLSVGGVIEGTVTTENGPASNLHVYFEDEESGQYLGGTNTDENGQYIYALPAGSYRVVPCPDCSGPEYQDYYANDRQVELQPLERAEINFHLELGGRICGYISDGNVPLPNIHVFFTDSTTNEYFGGTSTGPDGGYCYTLPDGKYRVNACPNCDNQPYIDQHYPEDVEVTQGNTVFNINFTLSGGGMICGTVIDEEVGEGIEGISLNFTDKETGEWQAAARTDSAGEYCATLAPGEYTVETCANCDNQPYVDQFYPEDILVNRGETITDIDFSLSIGGMICGIIETGEISPEGIVMINATKIGTDEWGGGILVNESGPYCFTVAPGDYRVDACSNCDDEEGSSYTNYPDPVHVEQNEVVENINLDLRPQGEICGNVTYAGQPLADIVLEIRGVGTQEGWTSDGRTAEEGGYCMGVPAGNYVVTACPGCTGDRYEEVAYPEEVRVMPGQTVEGINIQIGPFDHDNDGIEDWWEIRYFGGIEGASATTDHDHDGYSDLQEFLNYRQGIVDPDGEAFDPQHANAAGGNGYEDQEDDSGDDFDEQEMSLQNGFWDVMTPVIINAARVHRQPTR